MIDSINYLPLVIDRAFPCIKASEHDHFLQFKASMKFGIFAAIQCVSRYYMNLQDESCTSLSTATYPSKISMSVFITVACSTYRSAASTAE